MQESFVKQVHEHTSWDAVQLIEWEGKIQTCVNYRRDFALLLVSDLLELKPPRLAKSVLKKVLDLLSVDAANDFGILEEVYKLRYFDLRLHPLVIERGRLPNFMDHAHVLLNTESLAWFLVNLLLSRLFSYFLQFFDDQLFVQILSQRLTDLVQAKELFDRINGDVSDRVIIKSVDKLIVIHPRVRGLFVMPVLLDGKLFSGFREHPSVLANCILD